MQRLAKEHLVVRRRPPPNYFFKETDSTQSVVDDLTQLDIQITGAQDTPYENGTWHLRLNIPENYPQCPPTATFQTRIFHPNVAEDSGVVCLETLKRDWDPKLTLSDILVTISCLLIQPNPDSALNQKAGAMIQDDFDKFARQARMMTKIHALIPPDLMEAAAKARGTDRRNTVKLPTDGKTSDGVDDRITPRTDVEPKASKKRLSHESILTDFMHADGPAGEPRLRRKYAKYEKGSDAGVRLDSKVIHQMTSEETGVETKKVGTPEIRSKKVFRVDLQSKSSRRHPLRLGIHRL